MRAEVERAYQGGGLAAAMGPSEEEEEPLLTVDEIVERTTSPGKKASIPELIMMNRQTALDRLRQGRTRVTERRERQQQADESSKWLAFAQGMLAPTRTGGFGESLGMTAGLLGQQTAIRAEHEAGYDEQLDAFAAQEIAVESNAVDQLLKMAGYSNQAKTLHGAIQTMVAPEDKHKPIAEQRIIFGVVRELPSGDPDLQPLKDSNDEYFIAADRLDPARAAALITATERAEAGEGRDQAMIDEAYSYKSPIRNVRRANAIFENAETIIETKGVNVLKNRLANFLGIDFGDTVELTELQMIVAEDYLKKLTALKGNTSDRDVMEMKGISVGMGQNTTANYRQLKNMEAIYSSAIRRGIREAYQRGNMDEVSDLWESAEGNPWIPGAGAIEGTKAAYDALPPGTVFFIKGDWGGAVYTKPLEEDEEE